MLNIDDEHTQSRMPTFIGLHDMPAGVILQQAYQRDVGGGFVHLFAAAMHEFTRNMRHQQKLRPPRHILGKLFLG